MDTIARVRREFYVRGRSIKEICRELDISRNTVRKILRSGATAFEYERSVQPQPKIGPWREELDRLLAVNAGRAGRERLTLMRVFEELRSRLREERLRELSAKGDDLERVNVLVDFEAFRPELELAVPRADRSKGGRPTTTG